MSKNHMNILLLGGCSSIRMFIEVGPVKLKIHYEDCSTLLREIESNQ